jgi:hypothetical protein
MASTARDVFINCPFDKEYKPLLWAIVFVVLRSGFRPRCALETDDSSENRFDKICNIIKECRYGIHDISRTELDGVSKLPRFNMPLELGVFIAAKRFGVGILKAKRCIIFERREFQYQKYISDLSGQDIHNHDGSSKRIIAELATWFRNQARGAPVPGGTKIAEEFQVFRRKIPRICSKRDLEEEELTFGDYAELVAEYLIQFHP